MTKLYRTKRTIIANSNGGAIPRGTVVVLEDKDTLMDCKGEYYYRLGLFDIRESEVEYIGEAVK